MNKYIFLTTEGITYAPWDEKIDEAPQVENCQMLGITFGENQQDAQQNLLKENPWIIEAGFNPDEIFGHELAKEVKIIIEVRHGIVECEDCPDGVTVELHDYDINEVESDNPDRNYGHDMLGDYEISEL